MSFYIKKSQDYSHYNRALGTYVSSKRDYQEKMKRAGCEPYDPSKVRKIERKPYAPSKECREVTRAACEQLKRDGHVSGSVKSWVAKNMNCKPVPDKIRNATKGGIYAD